GGVVDRPAQVGEADEDEQEERQRQGDLDEALPGVATENVTREVTCRAFQRLPIRGRLPSAAARYIPSTGLRSVRALSAIPKTHGGRSTRQSGRRCLRPRGLARDGHELTAGLRLGPAQRVLNMLVGGRFADPEP